MRRWALRPPSLAVVALAASVALVLPSVAAAKGRYGKKVDPAVAAAAIAAGANADAELHVIVFGDDPGGAADKVAARRRRHLSVIGAIGMTVTVRELDRLATDPHVSYIAPDFPVQPTTTGTPLSFPSLSTIFPRVDGAPTAWSQGITGEGVGIAVIDSGTAPVTDFSGRLTQVQLAGQTTFADAVGHGSFVAGVAAGSSADGRYVGVAPKAKVYAVNVQDPTGLYSSNVILGLDWVAANKATYNIRVVNISLSEMVAASYVSSALDAAVERLWSAGVVVVVSAGNLGPNTALYAPGNDPFAITVGALDTADTAATTDDLVASFSSSGTTQDGFAKPDLLAPGRHVASVLPAGTVLAGQAPAANILAPGYASMSGTSFAAPQVAGAAAMLLQAHPTWTPNQVKWVLAQTARPVAGSRVGALEANAAATFAGTLGAANQGVTPILQPGTPGSTVAATNGSWNNGSWTNGSWTNASWNFSPWD
jgi:serine protease AprX